MKDDRKLSPRFDAWVKPIVSQGHMDLGETMFFLRELEEINKEGIFDIEYAELKAKTFVPQKDGVDPGVESYTYDQFDKVGKAKRITGGAGDVPMVNAFGVQATTPMAQYGAGFTYSIDELRAAAKVGRPLDRIRAETAYETLMQQVDEVIANGDTGVDGGGSAPLTGFLKLSNTNTYTVAADGAGNLSTFASKTPDQIIRDVNGMLAKLPSDSLGIESASRIIFPIKQFEYMRQTARQTVSDTTILKFLRDNNPGVEFTSWERMTLAGGGGSSDRMLAYRPEPRKLFNPVSVPFEQMAPQLTNFGYKVLCRVKLGGVINPKPKSIIVGDGI